MTQACHYCNVDMPAPTGERYTPCAACGKRALTVYSDVSGGAPLYRYTWRKDAANTAAVRLPVELVRLLKRPGAIKLALDTLRDVK